MKTSQIVRSFAVVVAAFSLGLGAYGAETYSKVKQADQAFLEKAAHSGSEEVAISRVALPHLSNAQVQQFAQMMVTDHTNANEELAALAQRKGVSLSKKQPDLAKWEKKRAKGYDEDYVEKMIKDHDEAIDLYTKASKKSGDPEVQAFAAKMLPSLQAHREQAKALKKAL